MKEHARREPIRMPELGIEQSNTTLSVWLVRIGTAVAAGDRVVEILTGEAVVDLPAPIGGVLVEKLVREDQSVQTGQILGWIERDPTTAG